MRSLTSISIMLSLVSALVFSGCKKANENEPTDNSQTTQAGDEAFFQQETDQIGDDADDAIAGKQSFSGARLSGLNSLCNVSVDSIGPKQLKISFNGNTCDGKRSRKGYATVQLTGRHWRDSNSVLTIVFHDVQVTRSSDGKSISINGTKTIKNLSGGLMKELLAKTKATPLVHEMEASLKIAFEDKTVRDWHAHGKRIISLSGKDIKVEVQGLDNAGGYANVISSGTTRGGLTFYTTLDLPLILNSCTSNGVYNWTLIQGVKTHHINQKEVTVTFGVDKNGAPVNVCGAYGYKVNWTSATGKTMEWIGAY